jgi:hypothetical protein
MKSGGFFNVFPFTYYIKVERDKLNYSLHRNYKLRE